MLWFFPAFSPPELLARLDGEPKRESRKLILSILEVHGAPCRPLLLDRLTGYLRETLPDPEGYYARNAVFLLRRIPRGEGEDLTREFDLLRAFSHPDPKKLVTLRKQVAPREVSDYTFKTWTGKEIALFKLFGKRDELMVIHNMGKQCPYCTLWADGTTGSTITSPTAPLS